MVKKVFDEGHINFFNVDLCGLYRFNSKKDKQVYGLELSDVFTRIMNWVGTRNSLLETTAWEPNSRGNTSDCYLKDIYQDEDTGDFFVVLWKSDPSSKSVFGADEGGAVGTGSVFKHSNEVGGKKVIWGSPCYYWICPSKETVMSIKFNHSVCDAQLFEDYISSVIRNRVPHPSRVKTQTDTQTIITFTSKDSDSSLYFRFKKSLITASTTVLKLIDLAPHITHIIKRESVVVSSNDEKSEWLKLLGKLPLMQAKAKSKTRQIEVRAEVRPSISELEKIIDEAQKDGTTDNLGFTDGSRTVWLDKYRLKESITIPDKKDELINAVEISEYINEKRNKILESLSDKVIDLKAAKSTSDIRK